MNLAQQPQPFHTPSSARARALRRAAPIPVNLAPGELRARRRQSGLGIIRAAEFIGVTPGHLSRAERGLRHLGATRTIHALGIYTVLAQSYTPVKVTAIERSVPELLARAIAGGSDAPVRASREALERLAATFNARRL